MADLTLYQFPGAYGLASLSPFCTKLDAYLRLTGVEYDAKLGDPRQAPKGKLPGAGGSRTRAARHLLRTDERAHRLVDGTLGRPGRVDELRRGIADVEVGRAQTTAEVRAAMRERG